MDIPIVKISPIRRSLPTGKKSALSRPFGPLPGISKQDSLPFLAHVESGYCQVAEESRYAEKRMLIQSVQA